MPKIDLHNHLGPDGANPGFDETIDIVHKKLGEGGIFGICNDGPEDWRYENFINQPGGKYDRDPLTYDKGVFWIPQKDIYVVGVEEVEPKEGSFIAVGMPPNEKIHKTKGTLKLEDAIKAAIDFNTKNIIVHPFFKEGMGPYLEQIMRTDLLIFSNFLRNFHGFEVYNASAELGQLLFPNNYLPRNANPKAAQFYEDAIRNKFDVGTWASTDGHSVGIIGTSYTESENPPRKDHFMSDLGTAIVVSRDDERLHKEPAKWDAFKHAYYIGKHMIFGTAA